MALYLTEGRIQVPLSGPQVPFMIDLLHLCLQLPLYFPTLNLLQPQQTLCSSSHTPDMLPLQNLCNGYFLCLEFSSITTEWITLISFKSLLRYHLQNEIYINHLLKIAAPTSSRSDSPDFALLIFSSWHFSVFITCYLPITLIGCVRFPQQNTYSTGTEIFVLFTN